MLIDGIILKHGLRSIPDLFVLLFVLCLRRINTVVCCPFYAVVREDFQSKERQVEYHCLSEDRSEYCASATVDPYDKWIRDGLFRFELLVLYSYISRIELYVQIEQQLNVSQQAESDSVRSELGSRDI